MADEPVRAGHDIGVRTVAPGMARGDSRITGRMILGFAVMFLGILWTLDNLDLVESEPILEWWPVVVLAVGVAKLLGIATRRHLPWGIVFTLAGSWLLAANLDLVHTRLWDLWPVALVLLGFALLSRSMSRQAPVAVDDHSAVIHTFAMWSGVTRKVLSHNFQGGDLTAVMGGAEIDLRGARTVPGGAVLDLFVWWGGIDLTVPEGWRVVNEATVLMGGIEDKSKVPPPEERNTVILRGLVVMGGVDIKN
jgi:predicted membrane protein